ncbi:MAG: gamma-glutamyltransferase [Armatimonadetes bacterium]|nr:gamma-glutamyltransferase [Armatimonadota bacterium]
MKGMITAPQPLAVDAGARVLAAGGNAVDAAVTAAFVQMVVTPGSCGLGGFGTMNVHEGTTGREVILDFHGKAGARATPDMWQDQIVEENTSGYGYTLLSQANQRGYQAITTPGTVAGLHKGIADYGTMPWRKALRPAIELARRGFEVSQSTAQAWQKPPVGRETSPWRIAGRPEHAEGGLIVANPEMAETLETLAEGGEEVFYRGDLARRMAEDLERGGGFVTLDDLKTYSVTVTSPLYATYRGFTVASNRAPGGGVTILQALRILEGYDLAGMGHLSPEYVYTVSMAMKAAWADRANLVGDPAFVPVPYEDLLSQARAREWRRRIEGRERITVPRWHPLEPASTTHLSVVDGRGNAVGLTHSLGSGSGSGIVTPGLGFYYNNCMFCFNPVPGHPNSIRPGKARVTGMAPTLVKRGQKPFFTVGAPGGTRIVTGVLHAVLNVMDMGMSATEAIAAPRFDCQGDVIIAHSRIPPSTCARVKEMGHDIRRMLVAYGGIASVHGIRINPETGALDGGADPGDGGMALAA